MGRGLVALGIILFGVAFPVLVYAVYVVLTAESKGNVDDLPDGYETD
ncbi:hypothetical protein ACM16X_02705 [Haloarcula japonica]